MRQDWSSAVVPLKLPFVQFDLGDAGAGPEWMDDTEGVHVGFVMTII